MLLLLFLFDCVIERSAGGTEGGTSNRVDPLCCSCIFALLVTVFGKEGRVEGWRDVGGDLAREGLVSRGSDGGYVVGGAGGWQQKWTGGRHGGVWQGQECRGGQGILLMLLQLLIVLLMICVFYVIADVFPAAAAVDGRHAPDFGFSSRLFVWEEVLCLAFDLALLCSSTYSPSSLLLLSIPPIKGAKSSSTANMSTPSAVLLGNTHTSPKKC